jgi:hypothetical protein
MPPRATGCYVRVRSVSRKSGGVVLRVAGPAIEHQRTADSSAQKRKGFCGTCGSPLYNKPQSKPDMIGVYVGTLDDPSIFKAQIVMFASRAQAWDHVDPALPRLSHMRPSA